MGSREFIRRGLVVDVGDKIVNNFLSNSGNWNLFSLEHLHSCFNNKLQKWQNYVVLF